MVPPPQQLPPSWTPALLYQSAVVLQFNASGDVSSFNVSAVRVALLRRFPAAESVIVVINPGSVRVRVRLVMARASDANAAVALLQSWSASDLSAELGVTVISSLDISLVAANLPPDLPPSQVTASPPPSSPPHPLMPLDDASAASDLTGSTLANCESEAGCATTLRFEVILAAIGIFVIGACIILLCAYRMRASCRRQHALGSSRDNVSIVTSPSAVNVQLHPTKQPRVAHPSPYSDCVEHPEQLEPLAERPRPNPLYKDVSYTVHETGADL